jgi:hypothetical protein
MAPREVTWSVSTLSDHGKCMEYHRRKYLERDATPPTTPQIRGGAVHRSIGAALLAQQQTQAISPIEMYADGAASAIDLQVRAGVTLSAEEASIGKPKVLGALKDEAVSYARGYGRQVGPAIKPIAVERQLTMRGALPGVLLRGKVDLIDQTPQGEVIRDAKTVSKAPAANATQLSFQLTMYDLLRRADLPMFPDPSPRPVSQDFLIRRANGRIDHERQTSTRGPRDHQALLQRIQAATHAVEAGIIVPANPELSWFCSDKYCPYWTTCKYVTSYRKD